MELISEIYEKTQEYKYIKEIHLSRSLEYDEEEGLLYDMKIIFSKYPYEYDSFSVLFEGLRDIHLSDLNNCLAVAIKIEDVSSCQLEGVHFKVDEVGEELFSFYCKNIIIV
jgi:hypothetical protein